MEPIRTVNIVDRDGFTIGKARVRIGLKTSSGIITKITPMGYKTTKSGFEKLHTWMTPLNSTMKSYIKKSDWI